MSAKRERTVAILGCGPSGLLAAHAVRQAGYPLAIFSMAQPSKIGGAQYLHTAIPGLTPDEPEAMIKHVVRGNDAGYQIKAYGNGPQPEFVSISHVRDGLEVPAWNLRDVYEKLWRQFVSHVNEVRITPKWLEEFMENNRFGLIVNSVPKFHLCQRRNDQPHFDHVDPEGFKDLHYFRRQKIKILNDCLPGTRVNNVIYYEGSPNTSWYRASNIFGTGSTEWGAEVATPFPAHSMVHVFKPVSTNCDCWWNRTELVHVGRFGSWRKGALTHHAYEDVVKHLEMRL